ncbi:MAG: OmpA family protein [Candidatus Poribacteria bacterium]|nr:OmpA family protein [Candidatus Poribacteria bacterium]MDE0502881.1 OmpA family protein [Candidatus Poribacteria bacterium]
MNTNSNTFAVTALLTLILVIASTTETKSDLDDSSIIVGASARALGMGGAFTAGPAGSDSFYWNPSSLGFLSGMEVSLVGLPYAENVANREGAFSIGLNPVDIGISTVKLGNVSFGSWFDGWGEDRVRNRLMLLGYGYSFGESVAAGANIRHHRRSRGANTHIGWSNDIGMQVSRKLKRLGHRIAFGLNFEDFDGRLYRDGQLIQDLPLVVRLGTAYHLFRGTIFSSDFTLHNDDKLTWNDRFRVHFGVEQWIFNRRFGIRFGYTAITNSDRFAEGEWSSGFSLRGDLGRLDYAYLNADRFDEGSHWIAASFRWNAMPNAIPATPPGPPAPILMPTPPPLPPETIDPVRTFSENEADFSVSDRVISPNGDGIKDIASFSLTVPENGNWTLKIHDERAEVVRRYSGTGLRKEALMWNGQDDSGSLVNDGTYTAQFTAFDMRNYQYHQSEAKVDVDTTPTDFEITATPLSIESSTDSIAAASSSDSGTVVNPTVHLQTPDLNQIVQWELRIVNAGGDVIDTLTGDSPPSNTIVWTDWDRSQLVADSDSDYHVEMIVHDIAGNRNSKSAPLQLIDPTPEELPVEEEVTAAEVLPHEVEDTEKESEAGEVVMTLPGIAAFDTGSYEISDDYRTVLEKVANVILEHPKVKVNIEGHTDSVGNAEYNLKLSHQRAEALKEYLVHEFGISWARMKAIGYGEEKPIVDNDVESIRHINRRVEIVLSISGPLALDAEKISEITNRVKAISGEITELNSRLLIPSKEDRRGKWTVMVSSFKSREPAKLLVENLKSLDLANFIEFARVDIKSRTWYRVTVGRFKDEADAMEFADELRESQGIEPLVISRE